MVHGHLTIRTSVPTSSQNRLSAAMPRLLTTQCSRLDRSTNRPHTKPGARVSCFLAYTGGSFVHDSESEGQNTFYRGKPRPVARPATGHETAQAGTKRTWKARSSAGPEDVAQHVWHVLQLPGKQAFNPRFLFFLKEMTTSIETYIGKFHLQKSWFDSTSDRKTNDDGHAEGFVLPTVSEVSSAVHVHL